MTHSQTQGAEGAGTIPCGGCGAKSDAERCMGCLHDFGDEASAWTRKAALASPAPAEGAGTKTADWRKVMRALIKEHSKHICLHEETHRGGSIWTICDHCGQKWADDQGGFQPYEEPAAVTAAWALLKCEDVSTPAPAATSGVRSLLRTARSGLATYGAGAFEGTILQIDAILAHDPIFPAPAATSDVPDSVRALSEDARDLLNSVLDWLRGVCPCGNVGPAQCPVCGARIDDPTGFCAMSHRRRFPDHLLGRIEQALGISVQPAGQDDPERCIACGQPLKSGERVLSDASGGRIHAACCGPERESYTGADGEPLGPNDPIPHGYVYEGEEPAGQERPDRKWVCNGDPAAHPAGQSAGPGAGSEHSPQEIVRRTRCMADETRDAVVWRDCCDLILERLGKPAPNSTRTGAAESPEGTAEQFIQAAVDSAPEPLKRLGRYLADVLDEDQFKTAERMLLGGIALAARPEAPSDAGWRPLAGLAVKQRAVLGRWCRCGDAEDGSEHWYWQRGAGFFFEHEGERHWSLDSGTFEGAPFYGSQPTHFLPVPPPPARPSDPAPSGQAEG